MTDDEPSVPAGMPPTAAEGAKARLPDAPATLDDKPVASPASARPPAVDGAPARRPDAPAMLDGEPSAPPAPAQAQRSDADPTVVATALLGSVHAADIAYPSRAAEPPPTDGVHARAEPPAPDRADTTYEILQPDRWDQFVDWLLARGAPAALGVLTLGMFLLYAPMFRGELAGDDLTFHMAESARIADCLRVLDFDLWNPSANAGFASAYYYQVVPQLVSAIPAAVFGQHLFFFQLSVFLPLVLAPAAAYRGMRLLGASPWQAAIAALAVGLHNGQSRWGTGNAGTFNVGLYTQTWALAAFPMALGHAVRWATQARGLAPAIAWGAFVTLCHPFAGVALGIALVLSWFVRPIVAAVDLILEALAGPRPPAPLPEEDRGVLRPALAWLFARWRQPPAPWVASWLGELGRLALLGVCLFIVWMPIWLPLVIDYEGFGGFPHRVNDEVGPGFAALGQWYVYGALLDYQRPLVLTWLLPFVAIFARGRWFRWLWTPAAIYAVLLGLGPHLGKTDDDLFPAVRFLGAMQVVLCLAIGAGTPTLLKALWSARDGSLLERLGRPLVMLLGLSAAIGAIVRVITAPEDAAPIALGDTLTGEQLTATAVRCIEVALIAAVVALAARPAWRAMRTRYGVRTGIAAGASALAVLLIVPGAVALGSRVHVLADYDGSHGNELHAITQMLQRELPGRKQVSTGAENHWWNLLSYEYGRRPSLLMMGGGGLQASPNYDFLWTVKDFPKSAWVYDAPYLVFDKKNASSMPSGEDILDTKNFQVRRLVSGGLISPVKVTGTLPPGRKPAHAAAIAWYKTDAARNDEVLAYDGSGGPGPGEEPHGTTVRSFRQDSPGDQPDMVAEVNATAPTTFAARESWHPRWHGYVDGVEVPVRRVTPDFPAVDVGPGRHTISFRFQRPWWALAAWLPWLVVPLLAWLITGLVQRRRPA